MTYDGTRLGCIGRCKRCGKAIQLRRMNHHGGAGIGYSFAIWVHMGNADHAAELSPGVGAYYDELIAQQGLE